MIVLLSPAKKLDFKPLSGVRRTTPQLLGETRNLMETAGRLGASEIKRLMKLSDRLAELNAERFAHFDVESERPAGSKPAVFAFDGDTYAGLRAGDFTRQDIDFAQTHLAILSGLYGVLRPLDAIQPYRLEMGTRLTTSRGKNLYEFWGDRVAKNIQKRLKKMGSDVVVNCASKEYASVVPEGSLQARIITPVFKELRDGEAKVISLSAKRARGAMARFIVKNRITEVEDIKDFRDSRYRFTKRGSSETQWLFLRKQT